MQYLEIIVGLAWIVYLLVWFISAFSAKRNLATPWWRNSWLRVIIAIALYFLFREKLQHWPVLSYISFTNPVLGAIGAFLSVVGVAIAIWARFSIGKNWGMPMSLKEDRELVTSGPYNYIRHPIYTGVIIALIGTALVVGLWLLIIAAIAFLYFIVSAVSEEKTLTKEFRVAYPAYQKRTKMLIPFVV